MKFTEAIAKCFKNYQVSFGRASRSEFWYWQLFWIGGNELLTKFDSAVLGLPVDEKHLVFGTSLVFGLAGLLPTINVDIRRLHDVNRNGWWLLIALTGIGVIPLIFLWCMRGTEGPNRWGNDPLAEPPATGRTYPTVPRPPPQKP